MDAVKKLYAKELEKVAKEMEAWYAMTKTIGVSPDGALNEKYGSLLDTVVRALAHLVGDTSEDSWTSWWLYECKMSGKEYGVAYIEGCKRKIKNASQLYDLIQEWKKINAIS